MHVNAAAAILKTKHGLVNGAIAATTITQPLIAQSTIASEARNSFDLYSLRYLAEDILIEPYKTVLSGDDECIIAIRINEREAI